MPLVAQDDCFGIISMSKTSENPDEEYYLAGCSVIDVCVTIENPCNQTNIYTIVVGDQDPAKNFYTIVDEGSFEDLSDEETPFLMRNPQAVVESGESKDFCFKLIFGPKLEDNNSFLNFSNFEGLSDTGFYAVTLIGGQSIFRQTLFSTGIDRLINGIEAPVYLSEVIGSELLLHCDACDTDNDTCYQNPLQNVAIYGTLIIDEDYCFLGSNPSEGTGRTRLLMHEDARIIVQNGVKLKIDRSNLFRCDLDNKWKGIIVEPGGKLILKNSLIEGAKYGVSVTGGDTTSVSFVHNTFLNNDYGIRVPSVANGVNEVKLIHLLGNTFTSDDNFHVNPNPNAFTMPYAGIYLNDQKRKWDIGAFDHIVVRTNNFSNLNKGIIAKRSNIASYGNEFRKLESFEYDPSEISPPYLIEKSIGIQAIGDPSGSYTVEVYNEEPSEIAMNFYDMDIGIEASYVNLKVENNYFRKVTDGIIFKNSINHDADILDNEIIYFDNDRATGVGISINNVLHGRGASVKVERNYIWMYNAKDSELSDGIGIAIEGCKFFLPPPPPPSQYPQIASLYPKSEIRNNYIALYNAGKTGIFIRNMHQGFVKENSVILGQESRYKGIHIKAASRNEIKCNLVERELNPMNGFTGSKGMQMEGTSQTSLHTNEVIDMEKGIHILFSNSGATITRNTFVQNFTGLQYGREDFEGEYDYVNTGEQIHKLNVWSTDCQNCPPPAADELGARHYGMVESDIYYVDYSDNDVLEPTRNEEDWFFNQNNSGNPSLDFYCQGGDTGSHLYGYTVLDEGIIMGDFPELYGLPHEGSAIYTMRKRLLGQYEGALTHWSDMPEEVQEFLEAADEEYYGRAYTLDRSINEVAAAENYTEQIQTLIDKKELLEELSYQIREASQALAQALENGDDTESIESDLNSLYSDYLQAFEDKQEIIALLNGEIKAAVADLGLISNSNLDGTEDYIKAQRAVNDASYKLMFNTDLEDQMEIVEGSRLKGIANMCPVLGGDAVYQARDLLARYLPGMIYNDEELCDASALGRSSQNLTKSSLKTDVFISPNPTSDYIILSIRDSEIKSDHKTSYRIMNGMGLRVMQGSFIGTKAYVDIRVLDTGMYYIETIREGSSEVSVSSFVVHK